MDAELESTLRAIGLRRQESLRRSAELQRQHDSGKRWCVTHSEFVSRGTDCCLWAECGHRPQCDVRALLIADREQA